MKHLKSYKIFEKSEFPSHIDSDIIYTLKDISIDLEDIGFFVSISYSPITEPVTSINIKIQKREGGYFNFTEDVSESLLRIYQYMRELGWYSKLKYNKSSIQKKFYIRPDDRMRDEDIAWIDDRWPGVSSIEMTWSTSNTTYYTFEGISNTSKEVIDTLVFEYGDVIHDMNKDIEFIEDKLSEINDLGYFTNVTYTPMTFAGASSKPQVFLDIKNNKREDFYGKLGQNRELIDSNIEDVLNYMEGNGYKVSSIYDDRADYKPKEFEFINNPTSYQISFIKYE